MAEYKLVIIGGADIDVGKGELALQFVQDEINFTHDPTIEDRYRKLVVIDGETCLLEIYDTTGEENFSAMRDQYMKRGVGFLLVFALDNLSSFEKVESYISQIHRVKDCSEVCIPMILVGHNIRNSEPREVNSEVAQLCADSHNMPYIEVCAKTRQGVEDAFYLLVREVRHNCKEKRDEAANSIAKKRRSRCSVC